MSAPRETPRIVSLLASGTELVCALGAGEWLVGRSHECDHPAWVKELPAVSRPTFDVGGSSGEIDRLVRERLRAGKALYEVDEEAIAALAANVLITQTHCEVCAVSPADLAHGAAARLVREQVVALHTGSLDAILAGFRDVAKALGIEARGEALVAGVRRELAALSESTKGLARPSVVCLEWIDPIFSMGNWGPELVELAGGRPLIGAAGVHSTTLAWDEVLRADPDALVIAPCGFGLERAAAEMPSLARRAGWSGLAAVRAGRVFVADGNLYFNRSGPSVFETPGILAEMLHPAHFAPRHENTAWRRWTDR
ncbi:MAG TPA: cobalamin-binding protein [Polyangiaceae bacterium]|jgi:iron complex transport system substrate-binding protein